MHLPKSLKASHEALRATLKRAMREPGKAGEAARRVASIADGHFLREEKYVHPLLAVLPSLARGESGIAAADAVRLLDKLEGEIHQMTADHREISDGLRELAGAPSANGGDGYAAFAEEFIVHAHVEEEVLYPAALVAGRYIKKLLGE